MAIRINRGSDLNPFLHGNQSIHKTIRTGFQKSSNSPKRKFLVRKGRIWEKRTLRRYESGRFQGLITDLRETLRSSLENDEMDEKNSIFHLQSIIRNLTLTVLNGI
ncbi:hypothetical protein CH367_00700 [Leptospira barantonii]|uniref:Uncharacterized protein n=1 Tax=Leptospira barantonii TaxID=2023184 RepID=A0ABX4NP48_9LEPT|nr:hypothetical protein CH367_00700 [Leptospira barantonii]